MCEVNPATGNQWCTYPDATCPSGRRWSDFDTGDGLSGLCVGGGTNPDAGADAGEPPDATVDTTAPTLTVTSPTDSSTGIDTSVVVSAVFSENIAPASATTTTFTLKVQGGSAVSGAVATSGATVTFTPSAPLTPDTTYVAAITTGITDVAGNALETGTSWTFTTKTGGWGTPDVLETVLDHRSESLFVASRGEFAIAVWLMRSCAGGVCGLDTTLWASVYSNGSWSAGAEVPTGATRAIQPSASINSSGVAFVVWGESGTSKFPVRAIRYENGTWSGKTTLSTENLGNAEFPRVAVDESGNAYAVWQQADASTTNIWANKFTAGGTWGTSAKIETAAELADRPVVEVTSAGTAVAVWQQNNQMWGSGNTGSSWSSRATVGSSGQGPAALVAASSGSVVAIWQGNPTSDIYASRYTGTWLTAEPIDASTDNSARGSLSLSADAGGDVLAVWAQGPASTQDAWYARLRPAQGWGGASRIENNGGQANYPSVAYGAGGLAMAVWTQPDSGQNSLWSNSFSPTTGWSAPGRVELDNTGAVTNAPFVFFDPKTTSYVAVWTQSTTNPASTYWSRFQ